MHWVRVCKGGRSSSVTYMLIVHMIIYSDLWDKMFKTAISTTESDLGNHCPENILMVRREAVQSIKLTVSLVKVDRCMSAEMSNDSRKPSSVAQLLDGYYNILVSEGCYGI